MIDELILVRVLPGPSRPSVPQLARELGPMFRRPPPAEAFRDAVSRLRAAGDLGPTGLAPTDSGAKRALAFLGLPSLPARWTWRTIRSQALPARVLGLSPTAPATKRTLGSADRLTATLLARQYGLAGSPTTARTALEALVCKELGHPECATLDALAAVVLSRKLGSDDTLSPAVARRLAPRVLLGADKVAGLRDALLLGWADPSGDTDTDTDADPVDADAVARAAASATTGRFGRDKVLVHHVWAALPPARRPGLDAFKRALVALNAAGQTTLARADLVQLMDPDELRQAEIVVGDAVFHFVRADRRSP